MEDIEYLDEYKDLVLPGIKTGDGRSAAASASAASRRRRISSDSSNSSSIDADIFQKLFHGKFIDDELLNEGSSKPRERHRPLPPPSSSDDDSNDAFDALFNRKSSKPKLNKRRDRFESFDSVDDLGQALMRPTQRSTVPKPSTSRGAGRKSETEGLHRGSHSSSSGFGKSSKNLAGPHSSGKSGAQGHHSRNAPQGSSNGSSSNSVSRNSKAVTIIKTQKADLRPPKNEPKTDPLNLREFYGDSDSDSSYEYESDFYGDRDTDDEEPVIDISTDTSRTTSVAETVTPVVSDDEGEGEGQGQEQQRQQPRMSGDYERLQTYLNNLSCAEAPPIYKKQSSAKKPRSSEKKLPSSEQVMHSKEQPAASPTVEQQAPMAAEPDAVPLPLPLPVEAGCSSSSGNQVATVSSNPYEVDPSITLESLERMTLDLAEQINEIDVERSFEFERRSASKPRSRSRSKISADPGAAPFAAQSHVRKLTYSNEQLDSCGSSQNTLRRAKSDTGFSKRGRGRSRKHRKNRAATTEEKVAKPSECVGEGQEVPVKRKRGRPRKIRPPTEAETALLAANAQVPTETTAKEDAVPLSSGVQVEDKEMADQMQQPEAGEQPELNTELDTAKDVSEITITASSSQEEISTASSQSHRLVSEASSDLRITTDTVANLDVEKSTRSDTSTESFNTAHGESPTPQSPVEPGMAAECETTFNEATSKDYLSFSDATAKGDTTLTEQSGDIVWQSLDGNSNVDERMVSKMELPIESMTFELPAAGHPITDPTEKPDLESSVDQLRADKAVDRLLPEASEAMDESLGVAVDQLPAELSVAMEEGLPSVAAAEARIELTEETDSQLAEDIKLAEEILAAEVGKGIEMSDTALALPGQRLDLENPVIEIIKELEQQTITNAFSPPEATEEIAPVSGKCPAEETAVEGLPDKQPESSGNEVGDEAPTSSSESAAVKEIQGNPSLPAATPKSLESPAAMGKSLESDVDLLPLATRLASRWDKTTSSPRREATPAKRAPKSERNTILNEPSFRSSPRLGRSPAGSKSSQERQSADETVDNSRPGREQARSSGTETDHGERYAIQRKSGSTQRKEKKKKRTEKDKAEVESQDETPTDTAETETETEKELAAPAEGRGQPTNSGGKGVPSCSSNGDKEERAHSSAQSSRTPKAVTDTVKRVDKRDSPRTDSPMKEAQICAVDPKKKATTEQSLTETDPVETKLEAPKEDIQKEAERDREVKMDPEKMNAAPGHETVKPKQAEPTEQRKRGRPKLRRNQNKLVRLNLDLVNAAQDKTNRETSKNIQNELESKSPPEEEVKELKLVEMSAEPKTPVPKPVEPTEVPSTEKPEPVALATPNKSSRNEKVKSAKSNKRTVERSADGTESEQAIQTTKLEPDKTSEVSSTATPATPVEERLSRKDKIRSRKAIHTNAAESGNIKPETESEPVQPAVDSNIASTAPLNATKGGPSEEAMNVDLPTAATAKPESAAQAIAETEPRLETPEPSTSSKSGSRKEKPTSRKPRLEANSKKTAANRESSQLEASEATVEPKPPQSSQGQILKKHKSRNKQHKENIKTEPKEAPETTEPGQTEAKAEELERTTSEEPKAAPEKSESARGKPKTRKSKSNKPSEANELECLPPTTPNHPAISKENSDLSQAATEAKSAEESEQTSDETVNTEPETLPPQLAEKRSSSKKRGASAKQQRTAKTIPDGAAEQHALEVATPKRIVPITPRTAPCRQLRVLMRRTPSSTSCAGKRTPAMSLRDKLDTATEAPSAAKTEEDKATPAPEADDKPEAVQAVTQSSVEQAIVDTKEEQLTDKPEGAHQEEPSVEEEPSAEPTVPKEPSAEPKVVEESNEAVHTEEITTAAPSMAASVEETPRKESPIREETAENQPTPLEASSGEPDKEVEGANRPSTLKIDDNNGESVNPTTATAPEANAEESNAESPVTKETTDSPARKETTDNSPAQKETTDSPARKETTDSPVTTERTDSTVTTETTGVTVAPESSKSKLPVRALRKREVETPQPDEAARRRQKQQQQLEKAGKDKQGQKKPVRRRNQLEAEERPPQKRTKIEDVGTATASTSTATASASANASASSKGKYISLIGKDTIISTTTDPHEEPSRSSGGARKSNVKNPKGPDTTKHIIISAVPKKSLDAAAESPPAPSKKPLVQSLLHSYVDARKATQKDSAPAGKKGDPEKNIPSSTVLTKKGVVPASDLPGKKPAETAKGEGTAAALRKVNISVSVMPSKEGDGGAADAAGKSVATSSAATAAQVTKALLDAEKNIISARRQVDTKKKPEAKKTVKISAPDKPKNTEQQARKEPRRPEMAEQSNKPDTSTAPARKSLPHAEPPRKPEPRKSEEAARMLAKSVKMPAVGHSTFKANEAREREKYEQRRSDVAAIRGKAAIRTAEVETGGAPRDSSHERAGRTSRLGKGISLPTLRQTGISMSSHMTRAASSNRSLASTPIPMAPTPTPMAGVRRSAPKKPEPMVAPTPPDEALGPPKKIKRPARLPFGSRRRWSAKKRKATEDAEAESEATTQKRPRAEQEQDQEPEARPAPSIAFPVMITAASSSAHSPIPHSVAAGPAAVPATTKSQPTRTKTKLRKCLVKINRGVVKKWMAANVRKQPAAALQEQRSAPAGMPAPEPEPQTEAPAAESVQHQVPEPFPEPEPALDPAPAPAPLQPSLPTQPAPVAEAVQSVSVSVSVSVSASGSGQQAQKKSHGIPAMKLPIPIPVMEIKTEIEEVPPEAPMEEATLTAVAIPTPTVVAPDAPAEEELQAPEELVALAPSISSHQTTIRMSAPPAPVGRLVSSIPSASSAEASQKPGHTKIFSFLYPQRYQRSYGEVGLDFCCPNLDGPMRAIDPTRLHATAQVPVLELPQFMVITTKIISKADKDLPHKVRAKLAQLDKTGRPLMGQTVRMSTDSSDPSIPVAVPSSNLAQTPRPLPPLAAISNPPPPTASASASATPAPPPALPVFQTEVTVQSLTKQLPRGTTLTKKVLPPGAALPAAASSSMVASLPPALIQLPPICPTDKQRVELQTRVQMFDLVLQGLSRRAATLTLAERQRTIEEIVKTSTLMAIDVDVGTKLLENYVYYLNRATNTQTPMPSLRLNPVVTPAITQSTHTVASLLGDEPVAKRKFSTPSATATASATETASPSAPATKKPAQQRSSLPAGIPVYDADKNIIGYQCPTPNASIVNRTGPMASSTPLGPSTSAAAQSGVLGSTSKSARAGVQLNQSKKTKPPAGMAVKAVPKGSTGKRLGSGTIVSIHPPPNPMPSRPGATKPPVGVAQTLASLSTSPLPKAVPVPVPGSKSKSAAPTASGGSAGMNRARSPNVFIINQVSPTAEESILPDSHSVVPMQTEIKGELDDSVELIG